MLSKSGHAFIKQVMREGDGVYGGEMSAHHYFRDFAYCDSGMIPWLLVLQMMSESGKTLSELVGERMRLFPASGEINRACRTRRRRSRRCCARYGPGRQVRGPHGRASVEFDALALQPARLEHRAAGAPERGEPRQRGADARQDGGTAGADRRGTRLTARPPAVETRRVGRSRVDPRRCHS